MHACVRKFTRAQIVSRYMAVSLITLISVAGLLLCAADARADHVKKVAAPASAPQSTNVTLGDNLASVNLGPQFVFIPKDQAVKLLKQNGSSEEGVLGIIVPANAREDDAYAVICRFEEIGYVSDTDADKLNADDILNSYKEGTKEQNEERKELKMEPIYVGGWAEKPHYDKAEHQVIWAIEVKNEDSPAAPVVGINYNTRILGRRGVLCMNLVTDPQNLNKDKGAVAELLKNTHLNRGQTYAEYVPGKDKSAGFGLAGLILGGGAMAAAAKFGLFGALWKWILGLILVLKKFIIIIVLAIGGFFSKLFGKKKGAAADETVVHSSAPAAPEQPAAGEQLENPFGPTDTTDTTDTTV
ncbi:MAG TPA: DUF2167 domain-containing protein [Chroococcales cyanobacterium]